MPKADRAEQARQRFAPAKVNLALHVTGRRADGYHLLDMLVAFADIGDRVTWQPGGPSCVLALEDRLSRPEPVPVDTSNLAWRALALAGRLGGQRLAGQLTVIKELPSGAGIGGGSSDAAAVLRALLDDGEWPLHRLQDGALALGADVPVCLAGHPARVEGIGERIAPVALAHPLPIVLVWPGAGLSTPAVFKARDGTFSDPIPSTAVAWLGRDPIAALLPLANDLETPAAGLLPGIRVAMARLRESEGCGLVRMSGSGSTVVGYFPDPGAAAQAAERIAADAPSWWVRAGTLQT